MLQATANGKINLALRVGALDHDGLHQIRGLFQSISWSDRLTLDTAEADSLASPSGGSVIDGLDNLAWRAAAAVRELAMVAPPLAMTLAKHLPVAAGLGGGSADAAAALALAGRLLGVDQADLGELAPNLGSDVPFCFVGGRAIVSGRGEEVRSVPSPDDYAVALVVPPVELSTGAVYRAWDELGGPSGASVPERDLPPSLRTFAPLANDLAPAAISVAAEIADWRDELSTQWQRTVVLTGSGPTLFAFFVDRDEAEAALDAVPTGARATHAAMPVPAGWALEGSAAS
jgi:4-diphosphocytidyl-2-C-methyl-D-erythritol kinase